MRELLAILVLFAPAVGNVPLRSTEASITAAIDDAMTIPSTRRGGSHRHWRSCQRAHGGCHERLAAFARMFVEAGSAHGIDPWILAGLAWSEARMNPYAEGRAGEMGITQLTRRHRGASRFMSSPKFRERCRREVGACQFGLVDRTAQILERSLERCGSLRRAIGAYNTGSCSRGEAYADRVGKAAAMLRTKGGVL